jgi:hypothetical protein
MEFNSPWRAVSDAEADALTAELARELAPRHALEGLIVGALARRCDRDDVLFRVGESRFAIVHLTWRRGHEEEPAWPHCQLFTCVADLQRQFERDRADYGEP